MPFYRPTYGSTSVKDQMAANSAAWHNTADPAERARLHDENVRLASQSGGSTYNSGNGTWTNLSSSNNSSSPFNAAVPVVKNAQQQIAGAPRYITNIPPMPDNPRMNIQYPVNPGFDPSQYWNDRSSEIKDFYTKQSADLINQLNAAYQQSRGNLDAQVPGIHQIGDQQRNANSVYMNTQAMPKMYAALEQSGGYRGGDMASGTQGLLTAYQQANNQIGTNEANQVQQIQNTIAQLEAQKAQGLASTQGTIDANTIQQLSDAAKTAANLGMQQNQMNNQYGLDYAQIYGKSLGGTPTLAANTQAFNQGMAQQQFNYQVSRGKVLDDQWMKQFDRQTQQSLLDQAFKNREISLQEYQAQTSRTNAQGSGGSPKPSLTGTTLFNQVKAMQNAKVITGYDEYNKPIYAPQYDQYQVIDTIMNYSTDSQTIQDILSALGYTDSDIQGYMTWKRESAARR